MAHVVLAPHKWWRLLVLNRHRQWRGRDRNLTWTQTLPLITGINSKKRKVENYRQGKQLLVLNVLHLPSWSQLEVSFLPGAGWMGQETQRGLAPSRNVKLIVFHWLQGIPRVHTYSSVLCSQQDTQMEGGRRFIGREDQTVLSSNQASAVMSSFCNQLSSEASQWDTHSGGENTPNLRESLNV